MSSVGLNQDGQAQVRKLHVLALLRYHLLLLKFLLSHIMFMTLVTLGDFRTLSDLEI